MSHLVADDIGQGVSENLPGDVGAADLGVGLGGLDEHPHAQEFDHIVVHPHGGVDDLSAAGVGPRRTHGVLDRYRRVADAVVADVFGIEIGVVFREREGPDGLLEAYPLKHLVPLQDGLGNVGLPPLGEVVVDPEGNGLDRFYQLSPPEGRGVGGLQAPAVHEPDVLARGVEVFDHRPPGKEEIDPGIGDPGVIDFFRQQQEGSDRLDGQRNILLFDFIRIGTADRYGEIVFEAFGATDIREIFLVVLFDDLHGHRIAFGGVELLPVREEEIGGVHDRPAGRAGRFDLEFLYGGAGMAVRQGVQDVPFGRGEIERHFLEPEGAVHFLERIEFEAADIFQANVSDLDVADGPDGGGHCPGPAQQGIRDVEEDLPFFNGGLDAGRGFRAEAEGAEKNR